MANFKMRANICTYFKNADPLEISIFWAEATVLIALSVVVDVPQFIWGILTDSGGGWGILTDSGGGWGIWLLCERGNVTKILFSVWRNVMRIIVQ